MTAPMIAPVLFAEEPLLLVFAPPLCIVVAGALVDEDVDSVDVLPGDAFVGSIDNGGGFEAVCFGVVVIMEDDGETLVGARR